MSAYILGPFYDYFKCLFLKKYSLSNAERTAKITVALLFSCTLASTISTSWAQVVRGLGWEAEACQFRPRCKHIFVCTWGLEGVLLAGRGARTPSEHNWERCQMFTQGPVMNGWLLPWCTMPLPLCPYAARTGSSTLLVTPQSRTSKIHCP